ncbi:hypothetical protein PV11_00182 [Exophiala sideris]|uniref:Mediator of RNA polymerase II transcription subunit 12 n=1 Tax=Exophiala sideris TaxID=1016849 RepID=A0A0D1YSH7_9EURO|nr:hypothetical protein PV11_00182 [Exophiala sideris]
MTSIPPAEPRPPRRPPDPGRPFLDRVQSDVLSPIGRRPPVAPRQLTEPGHDRPAKRRRLEGDVTGTVAAANRNHGTSTTTTTSDTKTSRLRLVAPSALGLGIGNLRDEKQKEEATDDNEVPDLPGRPWTLSQPSKPTEEPQPSHRRRVHVPVPTTPDSLATPASVPSLVPNKVAGFFPWTGKHPEDVLNDTNVKQGYWDKPPNPTEKELNTARVPLYNAFKHKSGVEQLSVLFSLVLDERSKHGHISSASTFKPPPRVTLTEAKRKSWIADLANADVPLRKLSRTIPQGIRGQLLLDQCLQNYVPLSRAIWFAKCVCANEIRTLKRKGTTPAVAMGTEGKWLREWTVSVQQFVESHLAQVKRLDWRGNIQYAIRLTTRLYMENLLDRDHYLDWVLRSFANADLEQLPFWLMVTHIFRQDLSYYRKRGRKLAETLLQKYESLRISPSQTVVPVLQRLRTAIRGLLLSRPRNFLMPDRWPEIAPIVRTCFDTRIQQERQILDELERINRKAMGYNKLECSAQRTPEQAIVETLDSIQPPYDLAKLADELTRICPDSDFLITTCLEWACTRFRQSKAQIYILARLIRRWQRIGHDTDALILNYLSVYREGKTSTDPQTLKHLIGQLSRSNSLSASKYLQWLMVRGLPKQGTVKLEVASNTHAEEYVHTNPADFLLDVSCQNVEEHVVNLRNSILERAGFDLQLESELYTQCIEFAEQHLAQLGARSAYGRRSVPEPTFGSMPWSVKSKVSMWLRTRVMRSTTHFVSRDPATTILPPFGMLNVEQFALVRHVLECMDDESVLADVVGILCCAQNDELVAALAATIQFHADSFSAIGALEVLQKRMYQIYINWRATKPAMPLLTNALLDLCTAIPIKPPALKLLQQDFVRGDRGRAVAACSPYSDGIAESLQQAGATFVEDFEAILQSEPNMTEQTMNGLFSVLVDRIEKQQKFGDDSSMMFSFCQLLSRLRLCRKTQADLLIQKWLARLGPMLDGKFGSFLFQNLIGTGCVGFAAFLEGIGVAKLGLRKLPAATALLRRILARGGDPLADLAVYQTRTRWFEYCQQHPKSALQVACDAGLENVHPFEACRLSSLLLDGTLTSSPFSEQASRTLLKELNRLLHCRHGGLTGADLRTLLGSVTVFSHRYVHLRFWLTLQVQAENHPAADAGELVQILSDALEKTVSRAGGSQADDARFAQLLDAVGPDIANRLRHRVENEFLEALPKLPIGKTTSPLAAAFPAAINQLSSTVDRAFLVCTKGTSPMPGFLVHLIERLSHVMRVQTHTVSTPTSATVSGVSGSAMSMNPAQLMSVTSSPMANTSSEAVSGSPPSAVSDQLNYILQMICLQRLAIVAAGRNGPNARQGQSEQIQLLARLAQIFALSKFASATQFRDKEEQRKTKELHDFILDVLSTIVDEVSDEVRIMCAKLLRDKIQDEKLRYVFGSANLTGSVQAQDMGQGLQLVKEGKGLLGDWKPRVWEVLDNGSTKENETSLGLGLFGCRRILEAIN